MRSSSRGETSRRPLCCSCRGWLRRRSSLPSASSWRSPPAARSISLLVWIQLRAGVAAERRQRDAADRRHANGRTADREDRLLDRLDRLHRVGGRYAAVCAVPGAGGAVLPVRPAVPRRASGVHDRPAHWQFLVAGDPAGRGQRRVAGRPLVERRAPRAGDRDRRGHGARAAGAGDVGRPDRVCDHVWCGDARRRHRVRARRARRRQGAARASVQGH